MGKRTVRLTARFALKEDAEVSDVKQAFDIAIEKITTEAAGADIDWFSLNISQSHEWEYTTMGDQWVDNRLEWNQIQLTVRGRK